MVSSPPSIRNFFQRLTSWHSSQDESSSSRREVVLYTGTPDRRSACLGVDYYRVLGVSPDASEEAIRAAYLARARSWHPDKNGNSDESKQMFLQLQRAYAVLSNPNKRAIYDRFGVMGLDVAERCDEDQQQYMAEFARHYKWTILLMCIGLLTCCFCCYCCFGCCSMCRRSTKLEEKQRRKEHKRREKRRAADLDLSTHRQSSSKSRRRSKSRSEDISLSVIKIRGLEEE